MAKGHCPVLSCRLSGGDLSVQRDRLPRRRGPDSRAQGNNWQ
jgi:hypothetical protein